MHLQTVSWQSSSVRASTEIGNDCNVIAVLCAASSIAVIDCLLDRSCSMLEIQFLRFLPTIIGLAMYVGWAQQQLLCVSVFLC